MASQTTTTYTSLRDLMNRLPQELYGDIYTLTFTANPGERHINYIEPGNMDEVVNFFAEVFDQNGWSDLPELISTLGQDPQQHTSKQTAHKRPRSSIPSMLQRNDSWASSDESNLTGESVDTSDQLSSTTDTTTPRVNTSLETPIVLSPNSRPNLRVAMQAQTLMNPGNLGLSMKALTCGLCGVIFKEQDPMQLFDHLDIVHFAECESPYRCDECEISFAHEKDLAAHLRSAEMDGDCGFWFPHISKCTGHHPPSTPKKSAASNSDQHKRSRDEITDYDRFEFCYRARHWEQSQVHATQDYLDRLIVATLPRKDHCAVLLDFRKEFGLNRQSFRTFSLLLPAAVKRLSAFSLSTWRSSHLRIDYSAPRPLPIRLKNWGRDTPKPPSECVLCPAIRSGDFHTLAKEILRPGVKVNCDCKPTSLHVAVEEGNTKATALLMRKGAALNVADEFGETAVTKAIKWNFIEVLHVLHDWDKFGKAGSPLLEWVLKNISIVRAPRPVAMSETVAGLLLNGHSVEDRKFSVSLLRYAVLHEDECNLRITRLLLQHGAQVSSPFDIFGNRERFAERPGHVDLIINHLIKNRSQASWLEEWMDWVVSAARESKLNDEAHDGKEEWWTDTEYGLGMHILASKIATGGVHPALKTV